MPGRAHLRGEPTVITRLRTRSAQEPTPPTLDQLRMLRDGLVQNQPLELTSRLLGISEEETVRLVIEVGSWIRQSSRVDLPKLHAGPLSTETGYQLFNLPHAPRGRRRTKRKKGRAKGRRSREWTAVAPPGYIERGGGNIRRPLAAILVVHPDDQMLERWMARTYTASLPLLTFPVVAAVWRFATIGMLDKLEDVSPSPRFAKLAVEAWELLELSRSSAVDAVAQLVGPVAEAAAHTLTPDLQRKLADKTLMLVKQAGWAFGDDVTRVARAAELLRNDPGMQRLLWEELQRLRKLVRDRPSAYNIVHIGQIREEQMRRICRRAGLPTSPPNPARVSQLRRRIRELGLENDADQLTPNAVVADQVGVLDEFMEAVKARADGDPDWMQKMLRVGRAV